METDLALVKRVRRSAAITSAAGIVIPFACGYVLGEMLPDSVLPDANRRLLTSLFLATALSISSVKIVAAVLREVDYLRRNLGQVILAAAILDDTIGWTILAFIGGLAGQGRIVIGPVLFSVLGTAGFLAFCFTIGRRWVARIIRWTNDHFVIEMPVITLILVIMIALALVNFIGVHTVLGAFVAGIMIGQSPILTKHIEEQLRGLIVALFMPVFFGIAGLAIDLKVLGDSHLLGLALLLIVIASIGKLGGCYLGSPLARLNHPEAWRSASQ
jgi:Kef-type K+ transport system membrane component KefB